MGDGVESYSFINGGTFPKSESNKMNNSTALKEPPSNEEDINHILKMRRMRRKRNKWTLIVTFISLVLVIVFITLAYLLTVDAEAFKMSRCNLEDQCQIRLVETIPNTLVYKPGSPTYDEISSHWKNLISLATSKIRILSYYWTLRGSDIAGGPYKQAKIGEEIFDILKTAAKKGIQIEIVQGVPSEQFENLDTRELGKLENVEVRSLDMTRLIKSGIIHTKAMLVDDIHLYVGSANFDWRSLTTVKELGTVVYNCSCMGYDLLKIFKINWDMAKVSSKIPLQWPSTYQTIYSKDNPMILRPQNVRTYISTSPPQFCTRRRSSDEEAIVDLIGKAKKFVYVSVMDYQAAIVYSKPEKLWTVIDDALKEAMYNNGVEVRFLSSNWTHTSPDQVAFLKSLNEFGKIRSVNGSLNVKTFTMPSTDIPFAGVNHNKYMVTDNAALISTSNWSGDYFVSTGGISIIYNQTRLSTSKNETLQVKLKHIFERDWESNYSNDL